jgi:hypothetical protein
MSAKDDRYNRSEKGRARWRRYVKRPGANLESNARRVGGGTNYLGFAPSADQASALNLKRKEFRDRQKQSRA